VEIQSVKNINSDVRFKSKTNSQDGEMVAFVDLNDRQLKNLAYAMSQNNENSSKKTKKNVSSTFIAMPIVDTIASGVLVEKFSAVSKEHAELLRKVPLSERTFCAAKTAAFWGVGLGLIGIYNVAKKALTSQSTSAKKFDQEHPVASFLTDIAAITAGFFVAMKGLSKHLNKYFEKNPDKDVKVKNELFKMGNKLDSKSAFLS